jgi:hypothetical protein
MQSPKNLNRKTTFLTLKANAVAQQLSYTSFLYYYKIIVSISLFFGKLLHTFANNLPLFCIIT